MDDSHISIHALREEGDLFFRIQHLDFVRFLSTPSARRATCLPSADVDRMQISIHALREEGDRLLFYLLPPVVGISIHALREEGDMQARRECYVCRIFLSTPSARRATPTASRWTTTPSYFYPRPPRGGRQASLADWMTCWEISIHALREEGD